MSVALAPSQTTTADMKYLMEEAAHRFRLSNFAGAMQCGRSALECAAFKSAKDRRKQDAIRNYLLYGHHANRCGADLCL